MIKDISKGLLDAVTAINQKSREAFVAEQQAIQAKSVAKQIKLPTLPQGKADEPAHPKAASMAKTKVVEESGSVPKTPREKQLAAMSGNKKKISFGDVLKARGVKMEETEQIDELSLDTLKSAERKNAQAASDYHMDDNKHWARKSAVRALSLQKRIKKKEKQTANEEAEHVEEGVVDAVKGVAKKAFKALTGGSDKDQLQALRKRMGMKEGVTNDFDYKAPSQIPKKPGELTGHEAKKTEKGMMYTKKPVKGTVKENTDTPGNSTHQCAIHVKSEQYGEGRTLTSQHAEPDHEGNIAWYDIMFAEGIIRMYTEDLEVLVSESHMMHSKKKKKAM